MANYWKVKEVAAVLQISVQTVYRYVANEKIPFLNRSVRFKPSEIEREGKPYITPKVQSLIDHCEEWPDTKNKMTKRQKECLVILCCGLIPDQIGEALNVSRSTVYNHLYR